MRPAASCVTADAKVEAFLRASLTGFSLRFHRSASEYLGAVRGARLAIIDSALPDMSGRDLVAVLRGDKASSGAVLVLTGPPSPIAAALCLDGGADEYFPFPPDPGLFRARILNLLSRGAAGRSPEAPEEISFGSLKVCPAARTARVGARRLDLTALEYDLLIYFLRNQGRVASRGVLLEQVWRQDRGAGPRTVDKRIEALRAKLGRSVGAGLRTVFGLGYIFRSVRRTPSP